MAILDLQHGVRGFHARDVHRRSFASVDLFATATAVLEGAEASPSTSAVANHGSAHHMSKTMEALAAVIVVIGIAIIGLTAWRFGKWRRQKARVDAASRSINVSLMEKERSLKTVPIDFDKEGMVLEKQAIAINLPATPAASAKRSSTGRPWTHTFSTTLSTFSTEKTEQSAGPRDDDGSPPPCYTFADVGGPLPNPPSATSQRIPPPALEIPAHPRITISHAGLTSSVVVPSPRSSSFIDSPLSRTSPSTARPKSTLGRKLMPRMVMVQSTFTPSLSDELPIKIGETLNMLDEYEDEWCLVQRVGTANAQRGVVPRFCLREKA
ncbi:hypothetical protein AcV7_007756 [Taiwanofungus camphoratus]|nr:hypothetical protein AcV7_007756 [Antrodia cinnamomea]